ncbi:MAG: glycosyltransferase [Candidatus Rokuibacteriota bacterium]
MAVLSVVVGTFDRLDQFRACVESIFRETRVPVHVWVTDAGSTDGTVDYLRSLDPERVTAVLTGRRLGQARAYNDVFVQVTTPYVCWLSDDNVVVEGGLDIAVRVLEAEPRIGMVGLKVRDVRGPFSRAPYIGGISATGILNVNQGVLRTRVLTAVGGFSEAFRDYGIDPDLTAKVLFSGHAVAYTRPVAIHHHRNWSADRASPEYGRQMERQEAYRALYWQKYGGLVPETLAWRGRRLVWRALRLTVPHLRDLTSRRRWLGLIPRDWYNIFNARYVSLLDPIHYRGREFHLVQYCPSRHRPRALPEDPRVGIASDAFTHTP